MRLAVNAAHDSRWLGLSNIWLELALASPMSEMPLLHPDDCEIVVVQVV
jgi:hypothetical protein